MEHRSSQTGLKQLSSEKSRRGRWRILVKDRVFRSEDDEDVAEILAEAPCPPLCCDEQEAKIPHTPMLGVNES
jgi:hypothetical protein